VAAAFPGCVLLAALLGPRLTFGGDEHCYLLLARALVQGKGYVELYTPGHPPHTIAPPGYPLMLAPMVLLSSGEPSFLWKIPSCFFALLMFPLSLALFEELGTLRVRVFCALLVALSPLTLSRANEVMTEMSYTAVSLATLVLWRSALKRGGLWRWVGVGALAAAAFYIRTIGIVLIAALFLAIPFQKVCRKKALVACLLAILVSAPWFLRVSQASRETERPTYFSQLLTSRDMEGSRGGVALRHFAARVVYNARLYFGLYLADPILPWHTGSNDARMKALGVWPVVRVLDWAAVLLIFAGFAAEVRRRVRPDHIYTLATIAVLIAWRSSGTRYLYPLFPLWIRYAAGAFLTVRDRLPFGFSGKKAVMVTVAVLLSVVCLSRSFFTLRWFRSPDFPSPQTVSTIDAMQWIKAQVPDDAVILCRKPVITFFYTGRYGVRHPDTSDRQRVLRFVERARASYVLADEWWLDPEHPQYDSILETLAPRLKEVARFGSPPVILYRLLETTDSSGAQRG
jgi:4-amino-4-deoxy-L-arabinose transferase-like glycosyltransferase